MWATWLDIEGELMLREPFSPLRVLRDTPACSPLFANVVPGAPPVPVPPAPYSQIGAIMESRRKATRSVVQGEIFALRQPDLNLKISMVPIREGWIDIPLPPEEAQKEPTKPKKEKSSKKGSTK